MADNLQQGNPEVPVAPASVAPASEAPAPEAPKATAPKANAPTTKTIEVTTKNNGSFTVKNVTPAPQKGGSRKRSVRSKKTRRRRSKKARTHRRKRV